MRKVELELKVKFVINVNEGIDISEMVSDLGVDIYEQSGEANFDIEDIEILDHEVIESK